MTAAMVPEKSSRTCCALVLLGFPDRFAEGATRGSPTRRMSSCAIGWEGWRTAMVSSPAETNRGYGRMTFKNEGQRTGKKGGAQKIKIVGNINGDAREVFEIGDVGDERIVGGAPLRLVDLLDRGRVEDRGS